MTNGNPPDPDMITFTLLDNIRSMTFAFEQRGNKRRNNCPSRKVDPNKTEFELHAEGAMGEWAVKKRFPKDCLLDYNHYEYTDNGIDLTLFGHPIQVKATTFTGPHAKAFMASLDSFVAPHAIFTQVRGPLRVKIMGWITREDFVRHHYNMKMRTWVVCVDQDKLKPMEAFKQWACDTGTGG